MWYELAIGISWGMGAYIMKIITNINKITIIIALLPVIIANALYFGWLFINLMTEKDVSELVALTTGVSNITAVSLGVLTLGEPFSFLKAAGIAMIILGVLVLKFKKRS